MDEPARYEIETDLWIGPSILFAAVAVACFAYSPFAAAPDRGAFLLGGAFSGGGSLLSLMQARWMRRWCVELTSSGIAQCDAGRRLGWSDVSSLRSRGGRVDLMGRLGDPPVRLYHQLVDFEEVLNGVLRRMPRPKYPPHTYAPPRRPTRSPTFSAFLGTSTLLALWLWGADITLAGFVLPVLVVAAALYMEVTETAAVHVDGESVTVMHAGRADVYLWRDISDVRFHLEYRGKGTHVLNLVAHTARGDVKLDVRGTNPFELYASLCAFREDEAT